jgi:hypothetical protein
LDTFAAVVFMLGCGLFIFVAAFCWGAWKAFLSFLAALIYLFANLSNIESQQLAMQFFSIFSSFFEPFGTFFSESWKWAKYEQPLIAFLLGCIGLGGSSQVK